MRTIILLIGFVAFAYAKDIPLDLPTMAGPQNGNLGRFGMFKNSIKNLADQVGGSANEARERFTGSIGGLVDSAKNTADKMKDKVKDLENKIEQQFNNEMEKIKGKVGEILELISETFKADCHVQPDIGCSFTAKLIQNNNISTIFALDGQRMGANVTLKLNGRTVMSRQFFGKSSPLCMPIPQFPLIKICVNIYEWNLQANDFKLCAEWLASGLGHNLFSVNTNCLSIVDKAYFGIVGPNVVPDDAYLNFNASKAMPHFGNYYKIPFVSV